MFNPHLVSSCVHTEGPHCLIGPLSHLLTAACRYSQDSYSDHYSKQQLTVMLPPTFNFLHLYISLGSPPVAFCESTVVSLLLTEYFCFALVLNLILFKCSEFYNWYVPMLSWHDSCYPGMNGQCFRECLFYATECLIFPVFKSLQ